MKEGTPILLSICIPTRNRASRLDIMLRSLLPQIHQVGKGYIQIVIANNASEDETEDVILNASKEFDINIDYYTHPINIGPPNLDFVVSKAQGKYILLSGDDDIYSPNLLVSIMPYLDRKEEFGILHWNRLSGDENCSNNTIYTPSFEATVIKYPNFVDFIKQTLSSSNFISSFIFNAKCWEAAKEDMISEKWEGYRTWARVMSGAAILNMQCIYYYFPLVIQRNPKQEWLARWPYYFIFELSDIFASIDNVAKGTYSAWNTRMHDIKYYDVYGALDIVKFDLTFYREHEEDMMRYLSKSEREYLKQILYNQDIEQQQRRLERKKMIKNWIKKIINGKK